MQVYMGQESGMLDEYGDSYDVRHPLGGGCNTVVILYAVAAF